MKLSVIVPVYNEKKTVEEILSRLEKAKLLGIEKEIIIVDDGSTDGTREKLRELKELAKRSKKFKGFKEFKIVYHQQNQGKGAAVRTGFEHATGDYLLIQDADLEYDPQDIFHLLKPIQAGKAEVVYGSRFTGEHRNMFFWHMVGNKFLSLLTNILYNSTLSDMEVGYKLFSKNSLKGLSFKEKRWGFDPEITAKVLKKRVRIYEVPISYTGREVEEGKKISWKDGLRILWVLIKYRFSK